MKNFKNLKNDDLILADERYYSMDCYKTKLNNNVLVVGAAGTGKTRSIVTPNLLQAYGSYIISDPKGNLYHQYGTYLEQQGYEVKLLDFDQPEESCGYNFFEYIRCEKDILKIAHMLVCSDTIPTGVDPFWDRSAELLLTSIISYLWNYRPPYEQNMENILKLVDCCRINECNPEEKTIMDRLMDDVDMRNPGCFTYRQYQKFRVGAARTMKSILITINSKLGKWDVDSIRWLMAKDEMKIATIGHRKTAVFVVVSDTDRSMDELANLFFTQAMNELCYEADHHCENNRLPLEVRFILDDFATNCKIEEFPRMIASVRSRGISTMLMLQAESQLEQAYERDSSTIIGNCDTYIYLGGNDINTAENVARRCNLPLSKILYMPVGTNWIFRRGEPPVNGQNFVLESYLAQKGIENLPKKHRENTADSLADFDWMPIRPE